MIGLLLLDDDIAPSSGEVFEAREPENQGVSLSWKGGTDEREPQRRADTAERGPPCTRLLDSNSPLRDVWLFLRRAPWKDDFGAFRPRGDFPLPSLRDTSRLDAQRLSLHLPSTG